MHKKINHIIKRALKYLNILRPTIFFKFKMFKHLTFPDDF